MDPPAPIARRRLLLITGAATASSACGEVDPTPTDATVTDRAAPDVAWSPDAVFADDTPDVPKEPFVGLDGGLGAPSPQGWQPTMGGTDVGAVDDLAVGSFAYNAGARAIIARDAMGFYAMSALCTHEYCLLAPPDRMGHTECPCHGSRFDASGRPTMGPAITPLPHLAVAIVGDRVLVDPTARVAENVRVSPVLPDAGRDGAVDAPADVPRDAGPRDTGPDIPVDPCTLGVDVGAVTSLAVGTWSRNTMQGLILGRDARGVFAFSATCTHSGCVVGAPDTSGNMVCACHGSRFDGAGRVLNGPAREPLQHYRVRVCAGRVRVDLGEFVADTDRTPVT